MCPIYAVLAGSVGCAMAEDRDNLEEKIGRKPARIAWIVSGALELEMQKLHNMIRVENQTEVDRTRFQLNVLNYPLSGCRLPHWFTDNGTIALGLVQCWLHLCKEDVEGILEKLRTCRHAVLDAHPRPVAVFLVDSKIGVGRPT